MSRDLRALAAAALRGTARAELPSPSSSALGAALARIQAETPEAALLARAAVAALHDRAGKPLQTAETPPPVPAPPAERSLPPALGGLLFRFADLSTPLARLALADVEKRGWTLGGELALRLYAARADLAPALWPLLDERAEDVRPGPEHRPIEEPLRGGRPEEHLAEVAPVVVRVLG